MIRQEMHESPSKLCYPTDWLPLLHTLAALTFLQRKGARPISPKKKEKKKEKKKRKSSKNKSAGYIAQSRRFTSEEHFVHGDSDARKDKRQELQRREYANSRTSMQEFPQTWYPKTS